METEIPVPVPEQPVAVPLPVVKVPLQPLTWKFVAGVAVSTALAPPEVVTVMTGLTDPLGPAFPFTVTALMAKVAAPALSVAFASSV